MKRFILILSISFFLFSCAMHVVLDEEELVQNLPLDPRIATGTLNNGLTYYLRENKESVQEAVVRLIVKVGSNQETKQQQGAAHFIEHMAFNGSTNFKKNDVIEFFRSNGIEFGPSLNAHTSWEETVYKFRIQTNKPAVLDQAFLVLEDWISGISFDPEEVGKERKIVIEEWRQKQGIINRVYLKHFFPKLFNNSRHAKRFAIGKLEVLKNISKVELKQFYRDWYQPKHMAIIIVGDIDVEQIEAKIKARFSKIENRSNAPQLGKYPIPDNKEVQYVAISDPEAGNPVVTIIQKNVCNSLKTEKDFRDFLLEELYISILNTRIITIDESKSLLGAVSGYTRISSLRFMPYHQFYINVRANQIKESIKEAFIELEKIKRFGFYKSELERAKKEIINKAKISVKEKENKENINLISNYVDKVIRGNTIISENDHIKLVKKYLPTIRLRDLNNARNRYNTDENRLIAVIGSEKAAKYFPTKDEIATIQDEVRFAALEPHLDEVSNLPLFTEQAKAGKITNETKYEKIGVTIWGLSNGTRVVLKPTKFKEEEILIRAYSPGGYSLIDQKDYWSSTLAVKVFRRSGIGPFTKGDLIKRLIFKNINIKPYIDLYEEGMYGSASPEDLEIFLQLAHLGFTQPKFNPRIFNKEVKTFKNNIENKQDTASWKFDDKLLKTMFPGNFWIAKPTLEDVKLLDAEVSRRKLLERFQSCNDFTLQFVGNFEEDWIKPLILKYIASLPSGKKETIKDLKINPIRGKLKVVVNENLEEKSIVIVNLHHEIPYSEKNLLAFQILTKLINIKIQKEIRETQSLIYSGGVFPYINSFSPTPYSKFFFITVCAPKNVNKVISEYKKILTELKTALIDPESLEGVKKSLRNWQKNALVDNKYWAAKLKRLISLDMNPNQVLEIKNWIEQTTPESVYEDANKYLKEDNLVIGILNPKNKT